MAAKVDAHFGHRLEAAEGVTRGVDDVRPMIPRDHRRTDRLRIADVGDRGRQIADDYRLGSSGDDLVEHRPDRPFIGDSASQQDVDARFLRCPRGVVVGGVGHGQLPLALGREQLSDRRFTHIYLFMVMWTAIVRSSALRRLSSRLNTGFEARPALILLGGLC